MGTIVVTGDTGTVTYAQPTAGFHRTGGTKFWQRQQYDGAMFRIEKIPAPGQPGSGVKRHGFSGRRILFDVVYIEASAASCFTARDLDEATMQNEKVSVKISSGPTEQNCEFTGMTPTKGPKKTEAGTFRYHLTLEFDQVRPN